MRIGIIRTVGSPCQCAEAIAQGLKALGHEFLIADAEQIAFEAHHLAQECDLIIDHTDTYRGRGLLRFLVRMLLETHGAKVVGSEAKACFLADDKIASKMHLAKAGVPTPPWIVICSKDWSLPPWLRPPLVLKPAFEHMSRGLRVARNEEEARDLAVHLLDSLVQPILAERFIPGRELAVSLLEGPKGLEVLPLLEWNTHGDEVLTESFKLKEVSHDGKDAVPADLPFEVRAEIEAMARLAFQVLGLRDYGRFDLRLGQDGNFYFLEANTTPSLERLEALALSAQWAGLDYPALVDRMLTAARRRYGCGKGRIEKQVQVDLPTGPVELWVPGGVHFPSPSSIDLARILDVKPGEKVLDLGCGSGLLAIAAAMRGADPVFATDLDPAALEATMRNARRNGVGDQIQTRGGSWYQALKGEEGKFDVIIATPPQTPGLRPFGPRYGGYDGTRHLFHILDGAKDYLEPAEGRIWFLGLSLANPKALWQRLNRLFEEVALVQESQRPFTAEEYEEMAEGLFGHFLNLRLSGKAEFTDLGEGRYVFRNLLIRAQGIKFR